ncbi:hypothetical protein LCGC14_0477090 [marine sediment metagenome]|uniref:DUF1353 domain-containing protein n=1 Tax=marine sediment metagenome TaxID=412755 RepID=A0A0F9STF2_9ZZZZ
MKRQRNTFLTPLVVEVMPSGKTFKLATGFTYKGKRDSAPILVPPGFITDFASIPRGARLIIPKLGKYTKASVLHDFIYQKHTIHVSANEMVYFTRSMADLVFLDAMADLGVAKWKRYVMYWAVRFGGWIAWKRR